MVYYAAEWLAGCLESTEVTNELMTVSIGGGGADESVKAVGVEKWIICVFTIVVQRLGRESECACVGCGFQPE